MRLRKLVGHLGGLAALSTASILTQAALPDAKQAPADREAAGVLTRYIRTALEHAEVRHIEGATPYYAAVRGLDDIWGKGATAGEAMNDLRQALEWHIVTSIFMHRPLPEYDDISVEIVEQSNKGRTVVYGKVAPSDTSIFEALENAPRLVGVGQ